MENLQELFGNIDIYLFDQLLKGRITPGMTTFDAGCGYGRNIHYFIRNGFEVFGVDPDANAVAAMRELSGKPDHFRVEPIEAISFPSAFADVMIVNTVLHFARDDSHFREMLDGVWRILKPGGLFFCRLASTIGAEKLVKQIAGRRYHMADGTDRYLVDEAMLVGLTAELGAELLDPIKTTVVQGLRSMTTWVMRKPTGPSS